jgi:starvation-inducible DNA-binding protein
MESLYIVLGDIAVYSQKAQGYHWNVTGPLFYAYHQLFGRVYEEAYAQLDRVAEHLRSLGSSAPGTLTGFVALSNLTETPTALGPEPATADLLAAARMVSEHIASVLDDNADNPRPGTQATVQLLGDLLELFGKHIYLLSASV